MVFSGFSHLCFLFLFYQFKKDSLWTAPHAQGGSGGPTPWAPRRRRLSFREPVSLLPASDTAQHNTEWILSQARESRAITVSGHAESHTPGRHACCDRTDINSAIAGKHCQCCRERTGRGTFSPTVQTRKQNTPRESRTGGIGPDLDKSAHQRHAPAHKW